MATRTLTLSNVLYQNGVIPRPGVQIYVYLQTPQHFPVVDLEGRVYYDGQQWGQSMESRTDGSWSLTDVYPGDLRDPSGDALAVPAQLVIVEGDQQLLSPPVFDYVSAITVSDWYPRALAAVGGMLPMQIDLALLSTAPDVGAVVQFSITFSADAPDLRTYVGGLPVPITADLNGMVVIALWPSSLLNPPDTGYLAILSDGTVWVFTVPLHPSGYQGAYDPAVAYHANQPDNRLDPPDVVSDGAGRYWQAVLDGTGHALSDATYWAAWTAEPIIWHRTAISSAGVPVIDTSGVRASPTLGVLDSDPIAIPLTLDDDLDNLAYRVAHGVVGPAGAPGAPGAPGAAGATGPAGSGSGDGRAWAPLVDSAHHLMFDSADVLIIAPR